MGRPGMNAASTRMPPLRGSRARHHQHPEPLVGGVIVALMGLEMLGTGSPSRAQGDSRDGPHSAPDPDGSLFVPFAMPLIAGPGAITVIITLAAKSDTWDVVWMALVAIAVNLVVMFLCFVFLASYLPKLSERAIAIFTRFGGLIVATIGVQLAFNGVKSFFLD